MVDTHEEKKASLLKYLDNIEKSIVTKEGKEDLVITENDSVYGEKRIKVSSNDYYIPNINQLILQFDGEDKQRKLICEDNDDNYCISLEAERNDMMEDFECYLEEHALSAHDVYYTKPGEIPVYDEHQIERMAFIDVANNDTIIFLYILCFIITSKYYLVHVSKPAFWYKWWVN